MVLATPQWARADHDLAEQYFTGQAIVLGHLNHLPVTHVYGQLRDLIRARSLRTVTLNDVFLPGR